MKLDIGCGGKGSRRKGFLGVDILPTPAGKTLEEYIRLDFVTGPLPWPPGAVDEVVMLHLVEHLEPAYAEKAIWRAHDLLKPGAEMTVSCPDLRLLISKYLDGDEEFWQKKHLRGGKEIWPGPTLTDRFNWAVHQDGHKWAYDFHSLWALACRAGCRNVRRMPKDWHYSFRDHEVGVIIRKPE